MIEQRHALQLLVEGLAPSMELHGFSVRAALLVRESGEKQDIVQPSAVRKSQGRVGLLYGARVRFPALERVIHGDEASKSLSGSYGGLSHLIAGEGYYDWTIDSPSSLPEVSAAILSNIQMVALPFFEAHARLDDVLRSLSEEKRVMTFSAEDQVVYRAAILWLLGRQQEAAAVLVDALEQRKSELPKKRIEIERVLRRFESA